MALPSYLTSVAAPEAGRPVGIPVVVERTTDTPSLSQDDATGTASAGQVDAIRAGTEANALIAAGNAGVTEHREVRRTTARGDHGLGVTLRVRCVDLDIVARTGREVLDLQRSRHSTAPLVFGVTGDFRESCSERHRRRGCCRKRSRYAARPKSGTDPKPGRRGCCPRCRERGCRHRRWLPAPVATTPSARFSTEVRLNTVGSSRPMVADTPLPNCAVYWMLLTPVT